MKRLEFLDEVPNDKNELRDFLIKTPLDANDMENEDFDNLEETPVLDYKGEEIGVKSEIKRKKYGIDIAKR